jgi:hypothetical protein
MGVQIGEDEQEAEPDRDRYEKNTCQIPPVKKPIKEQ